MARKDGEGGKGVQEEGDDGEDKEVKEDEEEDQVEKTVLAKKNREKFAIKKSYSIEVGRLKLL